MAYVIPLGYRSGGKRLPCPALALPSAMPSFALPPGHTMLLRVFRGLRFRVWVRVAKPDRGPQKKPKEARNKPGKRLGRGRKRPGTECDAGARSNALSGWVPKRHGRGSAEARKSRGRRPEEACKQGREGSKAGPAGEGSKRKWIGFGSSPIRSVSPLGAERKKRNLLARGHWFQHWFLIWKLGFSWRLRRV